MEAEPIAQVSLSNLYRSSAPLVSTPTATLILRGRILTVTMESNSSSPTAYAHINVSGLTGDTRPSCDLDRIWDQPPPTVILLESALLWNHPKQAESSPAVCVS